MGVPIVLLGLVGFVDTAATSNFYHASVGALFAYLGLRQPDGSVVRRTVDSMGLMLLLVKGVTTTVPLMWGFAPLLRTIELACFVAGVLSVVVFSTQGIFRDARDDAVEAREGRVGAKVEAETAEVGEDDEDTDS